MTTDDAVNEDRPRGFVGWLRHHSVLLGILGLIAVMLVGLSYLAFGALRWKPFDDEYRVTIHFLNSGGLQDTSQVTLRGAQVGDVESVRVQPKSVDVTVKISEHVKINRNTVVAALGLSAAGEQYVDFQPDTNDGPYLSDGDEINSGKTSVTTPFPVMLESALGVVEQIDPQQLRTTIDELNKALNTDGENQLKVLLNSGGTVFADLYRVLPQTTKLIQDSGTILNTTANIQPDLASTVAGGAAVINAAVASDKEIRTLLGRGPGQFTSLTGSLNQMRDPVSDALGQLVEIARQGALRAPTVAALLPSIRDAGVKSLAMFHDGAWWAMASIYPRPSCNYAVTPTRPTKILELTIPTNLYCVTEDPKQQIRGSVNAPRPAGDDTAGPPANYDPNARTVPLDK